MAKKKRTSQPSSSKADQEQLTIADTLGDDILQQLKEAKKQLTDKEQSELEAERERKRKERIEREKNKNFAELLDEYGDKGSKY